MKTYTVEEVKYLGFLDDIEENRKQGIVDTFNFTLNWLNIDSIMSLEFNKFEGIAIPLIIRIARKIDIDDNEVGKILKEARMAYKQYDAIEPEHYNAIDREAEFVQEFADRIIEKYKKQQYEGYNWN